MLEIPHKSYKEGLSSKQERKKVSLGVVVAVVVDKAEVVNFGDTTVEWMDGLWLDLGNSNWEVIETRGEFCIEIDMDRHTVVEYPAEVVKTFLLQKRRKDCNYYCNEIAEELAEFANDGNDENDLTLPLLPHSNLNSSSIHLALHLRLQW